MERRSFFHSFKTKVTLLLIFAMVSVVGLNNLLVYQFDLKAHFEQLRNSLRVIAHMAALAVDAEKLQAIPQVWDGVHSPAYREVAGKLGKILEMNEPLQCVYVLKRTKIPGTLRFLVDVDVPEMEGRRRRSSARPGDLYDASRFPEMLEGFEKPSADRELQTDAWGVTLSGYAPVLNKDGKVIAIVGVDILADDINRMRQDIQRRMAVVLFSGVLFCCVLGILIAGSVSRPIRKLVEGTRELAKDNLDHRVEIRSRDEIGELADSFNQMAMNLSRSRRRLRDYFFKVTQSLVRALEAKDPYTQGHSRRVADLARKIALELGQSPEEAELLWYVAELHDIGKLVVHENILNKKEKLDTREWDALREHPVTGAKILASVLDGELLRVIRSHHERVDGTGYPDGLKGNEIALSSQIVSIADTYDAMTSLRSYRKPLSPREAIQEIERSSGTQFRPEVVAAFLKVMNRPGEPGEPRPDLPADRGE